jgi:formylglycine-generating enzyme required for sulfatase activity
MLDKYGLQNEPCWSKGDQRIFVEPLCNTMTTAFGKTGDLLQSVRGGSWISPPQKLRAASRDAQLVDHGTTHEFVGFRCVRSAL